MIGKLMEKTDIDVAIEVMRHLGVTSQWLDLKADSFSGETGRLMRRAAGILMRYEMKEPRLDWICVDCSRIYERCVCPAP